MRRKDRDPGIKIKVFALRAVAVVVVVVVALLLILWLQERSSTRELANGEGSSILMDFPDHTEVAIAIVEDGQTRFHGVIKENQVLIPIKNEEGVFSRYGMRQSYTRAEDAGDSLVKGLNAGGEVTSNWDFDALMGAGGILSTVKDLSAFASAQFNKEDDDLMLTRAPTHVVNDRLKMGLGWHILLTDSGKELHCHNGGTGGYSSSIAINMADEVAVIVLSNVSAFHPSADRVEQLCLQLIDRL